MIYQCVLMINGLFVQFDGAIKCERDNERCHCVFSVVKGSNSTETHYKKHTEVMKRKGKKNGFFIIKVNCQ